MSQRRFIVAVALSLPFTQSANLMLAPLLVAMTIEFDTSVAVAGQLATVTFAAWGVSVVTVGPLSDSLGRRPVALAGLTLLAISVLASAFAPNLATLMVLRAVTGIGGGMIPPNSMAAVADSVPAARRSRTVGGMMAFATLSAVIGLPLVAVAANAGSWRLPFILIGSLLAACAVLNWFWFPKGDGATTRSFSFFSRYRTLLTLAVFRSALAVNFAQRIAYMALVGYVAAYLIDIYEMSVGAVALLLACLGIGTAVGSYFGGFVAGREDRMRIIAATAVAGGAAALLAFLIDVSLWTDGAIATAAALLLSVGWPVIITFSTEVSGQSRATGVGLVGASNQSGSVGGTALGGILLAVIGFPGIGYLCLGAGAFSAIVIALFMRPVRK